jgi:lipoprotein-anchoring transpeptidase ErfK/SrfK
VAAIRYDHSNAGRILPGITIDGTPVGGMTRAQAIQAVSAKAQETLEQRIEVLVAGKSWTETLSQLGLAARVADAVDQALDASRSPSLFARVYHRLMNDPVDRKFSVSFYLAQEPVQNFVKNLAKQIALPVRDATFGLVDGKLVVKGSQQGRSLRVAPSIESLRRAVVSHDASISLPLKMTAPQVTEKNLGQAIVVNVSRNMLFLYQGVKIIRSYPVATAKQGFLTPPGQWTVTWKEANPTWHNPAPNGWGKGEPLVIPPGPGNPLGTRALHLSASGILIHGTPADYSIGSYASHGCIRMHMWDAETLFNLVETGIPVFIIGAPPWGLTSNPGAAG